MDRTVAALMEVKSQRCIVCGKEYLTVNTQRVTCGAPDCQKKRHAQQMHEFHQRNRKAAKHKTGQRVRKTSRVSEIGSIMSINEACIRARKAGQSYGAYIANMNSKVHSLWKEEEKI